MDRFMYKLSVAVAKTSTRRQFLSRLTRGMVGAGLGASMLFGSSQYAFADANCKFHSTPDNGGGPCNGKTRCGDKDANDPKKPGTPSDANGCGGLPYCAPAECDLTVTPPKCKAPLTDAGYWVCCCKSKLSYCRDCIETGSLKCICQKTVGRCGA